MDLRKHTLEAITLIAAAILCALVANTVASRERKIVLVGTYPNATNVPPPAPEPTAVTPMTESTAATTTTSSQATGTVVPVASSNTTTSAAPTTTAQSTPATATQPRNPATPQPGNPATKQPSAPVTQQPANPATPQPSNPATPKDLSKYAPHPDKAYLEIPYKDVAALYAGGALFLDARRTSVYEQGHIAGARPFSVWESDVDDKVKGLWEQRQDPKEQALPIVIYCTGGDCEDSHMLAQKLWGAQFNNVYVYKDGFPDWQAKGGAIRTGATP
jgi:rhodanese-related sulfurtransferase